MKFDTKKDFSPKYLLLILTIVCIILLLLSFFARDSILMIKKYTNKFIVPVQNSINSIGIWADSKVENMREINELKKENEKLKKQLEEANSTIITYQGKLSELESLRLLYSLDESYPEYHKTAAHIFAKDSTSWFSTFYIDKGTKDGLFEGANVLSGEGVAGIIIECQDDYAKVRAIIDDNSSISAKIMPSNALCTVEGSLSKYQDGYLIVNNIDKDASVSVGDKVVTSHISDRYFQGLTIGYISEISLDSNNLTKTAYLTPTVDFSNLSEVLIITDEKQTLEENISSK